MDDWIDYYDSTHTIYVSKRHRDVHFERVAADIIGYIANPDAVVLDYACGEALSAPKVGMARDVAALLQFGAKHGFLKDAMIGLVRTALSDYRQLRTKIGLQRYTEDDMINRLTAAGFAAERAPKNIGHNTARMTFVARRLD